LRDSLPPGDSAAAEELIRLTLRGQYALPDWGAPNRSVIGAAGYYRAVQAMPNDPEATKWRGYAEALVSESWGHWPVDMPETDVINQGAHGSPVKRQKAKMAVWEE
jgi:hypothetical protein